LMAILAGLNDGPICRLKFTLEKVPLKSQKTWKELQTLMSADGSYKAYRAEIQALEHPFLPYLGICLRDLVYWFEDGGSGDSTLINFKQRKNVYGVIYFIQLCQQTPYTFDQLPSLYNILKLLPGMIEQDEELFKMSLQREPRHASKADIE